MMTLLRRAEILTEEVGILTQICGVCVCDRLPVKVSKVDKYVFVTLYRLYIHVGYRHLLTGESVRMVA